MRKPQAKPLKESELRELAECHVCKKLIGHTSWPILWKIVAERHVLDLSAIHRQQGLGMLLGGHGGLAMAMGPDEDMTTPFDAQTVMICDGCMIERLPELLEPDEDEPNDEEECT